MTDIELLRLLLNCNNLTDNWNYYYGITKERRKALTIKKKKGNDYFFNSNSETALTLFMLGNLDGWKQIGRSMVPPRVYSGWNKTFFDDIQKNKDIFNNGYKKNCLWDRNKELKSISIPFHY